MVRGRRCLGHDETKWGIALIWHVRGRPAPLAASPRRATALGWHACMHVLYTLSSLLCCHNRVSAANFDQRSAPVSPLSQHSSGMCRSIQRDHPCPSCSSL